MKVLITGAAGFIGSHLAEALLERGDTVVGLDNLSTGRFDNFPKNDPNAELIIGDIREPGLPMLSTRKDWRKDDSGKLSLLPEEYDLIFHCAASYKDRSAWEMDASTNVDGTINVIRLAQKNNAKLVYFQTSLCYGPAPLSPVTLDAPLNPRGSYAVSKTAGETYIRDSGLDFVSLRLANIYGPRNLSGPAPTFYQRLSQGLQCTVVDSRRDFVFIDDLVRAALAAADKGKGIYHVASGKDVSIAELYDYVAAAMGYEGPRPTSVSRGPDDVATILLDPYETYSELGWTARTPIVTGIHEAVAWYKAHGVTETFTHLAMKG